MYLFMSSQIYLFSEAFATGLAFEWFIAVMSPLVDLQSLKLGIKLTTNSATEVFLTDMSFHVLL